MAHVEIHFAVDRYVMRTASAHIKKSLQISTRCRKDRTNASIGMEDRCHGRSGGLLFGFDTAVIAGTTDALTSMFHLTPVLLGFTVTSALVGTIPGAAFAGIPADRIGRRTSLKIRGLIYIVSALGCALAENWPAFLIFRVIGSLGIGACSVVDPKCIAEICPAEHRSRMVGLCQVNVVLGILLAYVSNLLVSLMHFGALEWRWKFGVAAAPALLFSAMLFRIVESPRWLLGQGREREAKWSLDQIGNADPEGEFQRIRYSIRAEKEQPAGSLSAAQVRSPLSSLSSSRR